MERKLGTCKLVTLLLLAVSPDVPCPISLEIRVQVRLDEMGRILNTSASPLSNSLLRSEPHAWMANDIPGVKWPHTQCITDDQTRRKD